MDKGPLKFRRTFIVLPDNSEKEILFEDLQIGDIFRLSGVEGWLRAQSKPIAVDDEGNFNLKAEFVSRI